MSSLLTGIRLDIYKRITFQTKQTENTLRYIASLIWSEEKDKQFFE